MRQPARHAGDRRSSWNCRPRPPSAICGERSSNRFPNSNPYWHAAISHWTMNTLRTAARWQPLAKSPASRRSAVGEKRCQDWGVQFVRVKANWFDPVFASRSPPTPRRWKPGLATTGIHRYGTGVERDASGDKGQSGPLGDGTEIGTRESLKSSENATN